MNFEKFDEMAKLISEYGSACRQETNTNTSVEKESNKLYHTILDKLMELTKSTKKKT